MTIPALAAVAAILAAGAAPTNPFPNINPDEFEGLAKDDFAAWSYGWKSIKTNGAVKTLLVQSLYATPTAFPGSPTPAAYSIHTMAIDCAGKTVNIINGANYSASHAFLSLGGTTGTYPWSDMTTGFQSFASQVCQIN
jgi:hypothetical protein